MQYALNKLRNAARVLLTLDEKDPKRIFEGEAPQQLRSAKKARVGGGAAPAPKTGENVTALGFHVRPMGAAPSNDQGTKLVWAYKRGIWVDASGDGTWNGVPAADGEREAVAAEGADLERRLAALGGVGALLPRGLAEGQGMADV